MQDLIESLFIDFRWPIASSDRELCDDLFGESIASAHGPASTVCTSCVIGGCIAVAEINSYASYSALDHREEGGPRTTNRWYQD